MASQGHWMSATFHKERPKTESVLTAHIDCGLGELNTSSVWLVGVHPKQASPQLCLSFPEASAETQLLMSGQ